MEEDKTSELFAAGRGESRKALHQGLVIARTCAERPGARQQQLTLSQFLNAPRATSRQGRHAQYYWQFLAKRHLTRRLFASMMGRIAALSSRAG
jgi:hypothetical protein